MKRLIQYTCQLRRTGWSRWQPQYPFWSTIREPIVLAIWPTTTPAWSPVH